MNVEKFPIRLLSFGHNELQHSFPTLSHGQVGTRASKVGLQPLP